MTHAISMTHERRFRAEAERAWQESEIRFRLFMEHMPGAVYMKDSVAKRVIGLSASQIIGKTLHQLYPPDVADQLAANDDRALKVRQAIEAMEHGGYAERSADLQEHQVSDHRHGRTRHHDGRLFCG